jgi:hypothetical protein
VWLDKPIIQKPLDALRQEAFFYLKKETKKTENKAKMTATMNSIKRNHHLSSMSVAAL